MSHLYDLSSIFDKGVTELADVDETILMHADVHEGTKGGDVGDDSRQLHADGQILHVIDAFSKVEDFKLLARVTTWLGQLVHDVLQRRQAHFFADVFFQIQLLAQIRFLHEVSDGAAKISRHFFHQRITLRMHGAGVQRMLSATNAQEACGLLKGLVAQARDFQQVFAGLERAVFIAEGDDVCRVGAVQAGHIAEQLLAGGVHLDADAVHRADDDVVQAALQLVLIHIMLILADADGLRIKLHQLCQRVHETAGDGDGSADGDVMVGEFLTGHFAGAVDGGSALIHHQHLDALRNADLIDEHLRLAAGGAVADGDGLNLVALDQIRQQRLRVHEAVAITQQVDDVVEEQLALGIQHHDLAASAETGVDAEHTLLPEGRGEQELT